MISKAIAKYVRVSPYKVRRVANEIKDKNVVDAESYLSVLTNKGAALLKKVIHSARSNFLNVNKNVDEQNLYIRKIFVDSGPTMKRYHPVSKGRALKILKRSCHVKVEIFDKEGE